MAQTLRGAWILQLALGLDFVGMKLSFLDALVQCNETTTFNRQHDSFNLFLLYQLPKTRNVGFFFTLKNTIGKYQLPYIFLSFNLLMITLR